MAGAGLIAAAAGAGEVSPVGVATASAAACAEGAESERHRPKYLVENANVRTNAPTASPHNKSIRLSMSTPMKKR
jgi:hypothetical protein